MLVASTGSRHTDALRLIDDVGLGWGGGWGGVGGGVNNVPLDIHLRDDLFLLIASTGSRHTDALRLIDDVGLAGGVGGGVGGGGGGVNNVPLDIHLHDDLFLLIASTGSRHVK